MINKIEPNYSLMYNLNKTKLLIAGTIYLLFLAANNTVNFIYKKLKPFLIFIFFIIYWGLLPYYLICLLFYNTLKYIQIKIAEIRYRYLRAKNDALLHNLVKEKHIISIIRNYADD